MGELAALLLAAKTGSVLQVHTLTLASDCLLLVHIYRERPRWLHGSFVHGFQSFISSNQHTLFRWSKFQDSKMTLLMFLVVMFSQHFRLYPGVLWISLMCNVFKLQWKIPYKKTLHSLFSSFKFCTRCVVFPLIVVGISPATAVVAMVQTCSLLRPRKQ